MKTLAISNVAWVANLRTFVDGDVFRESNIDLNAGDVADRLGYLKANAAALGTANSWTALQTFSGAAGGIAVTGDLGLTANTLTVTGSTLLDDLVVNDAAEFNQQITLGASGIIKWRPAYGSDADTLCNTIGDAVYVPAISANRIYTLAAVAAGDEGARLRIVRNRTADAFTVAIRRVDATPLATFTASLQGWAEFQWVGGKWIPTAWGGAVTGINTDVV